MIQRKLAPGLYKLTVEADGRDFDWESLYFTLNEFGNFNRRTGPWDFSLEGGLPPVVPAYWVWLNGRKLGLWFFNRPSVRQLRAKQFKGEAQFWIEREGDYEIRFEPFRKFTVSWTKTEFRVSPDDRLLDQLPFGSEADRGLQRLFDAACWERLRRNLDDPAFPYGALLRGTFDWAFKQDASIAVPILAASVRLRHDAASLERTRQIISKTLALPAWGNPNPGGYSHNGDMNVAQIIFDLTFAVNFLADELGEPLVKEILSRLERQCEIFMDLALLQHGYWGGSILQGHGFISFQLFTAAAYGLLDWLPRAEHWLRFCLPRMERSWRALPTDGVIPSTSYHRLDLHVGHLAVLRELHRQATGEDIYDRPAFRKVPEFLVESYLTETCQFWHAAPRGDYTEHLAGHAFLDQMARTFGDSDAAWLAREVIRAAARLPGDKAGKFHLDTLWASLLWEENNVGGRLRRATANVVQDADGRPSETASHIQPARPPRRLRWFQDSGAILFRDDARGIVFSSRLGNSNSRTSWKNAPCPCDRINFAPMAGNFAIAKHGLPLIQTAEGGYSMRTELGNILLVDGKGQLEDEAYAMGYPDVPWTDERIEEAALDTRTGVGYVRMQLAPVYEGLTSYTREWFFEPDGRMRIVEKVASSEANLFTWLFHTYRSHPITRVGDGVFRILSGNESLELRLARSTTPLSESIADTLTVWSYSNQQDGNACHHLALESRERLREVEVEFVLR